MDFRPKAVFFDIDGTLLSHQTNTVPPSALDAVRQLRKQGILVFLATGRHRSHLESLPALRELEYDGAVSLNGGYCYNARGRIFHKPICREDIAALLDWLEAYPTPCGFTEENRTYVNFYNHRVHQVHTAIHTPLLPLGDLRRGLDFPVYQILLYLYPEDPVPPCMPHTRTTRWFTGGVDIIPAEGGKALGIQKVLEHYGIDRADTMAFGDGDNDLDMFGAVGYSVAMDNAVPQLRAVADFVTDDVDGDGIAKALKHLGLITERKDDTYAV